MLESTAVNAKYSGSGPDSRFTNFFIFCERWSTWNAKTAGKPALNWQQRIRITTVHSLHRALEKTVVPTNFGLSAWAWGALSFCSCTLLPQPLLTPPICELSWTSAFMVPFPTSANVRLNEIQPAKRLYLAVLVNIASPGQARRCRHAANSFIQGSMSAPGKLSRQVQL